MSKILVIEDEEYIRENLVELLEAENYEALGAANGSEGVQLAKTELPDLILCDVMMPILDGHGVLMELRTDPLTALIPFIFLTAKVDKLDQREGMNLGADDYLTKPCSPDLLLDTIAARLHRAAQQLEKLNQMWEQVKSLEQNDNLTGLPNEESLIGDQGLFAQLLSKIDRRSQILGCFSLGLDRFARINDTMGYANGNLIFKQLGERLKEFTQTHPNSIVARISGDEFAVIFPAENEKSLVLQGAETLLKLIARPFEIAKQSILITASIGISFYPQVSQLEELRRQAGIAMGEAKKAGGNRYKIYDPSMFIVSGSLELQLEADLHQAWENKSLQVFYQPRLDLRKNKVISLGAIIHWQHPIQGVISATKIETLSEESGLSSILAEWLMEVSCQQLKRWQSDKIIVPGLAISLPESLFMATNLEEIVIKVLKGTAINPELLEFEIPANIFSQAQNINTLAAKLIKFQRLGIRTTLNHFGIVHTSLTYLKDLALDSLKIDPSLMNNLTQNLPILSAIIQMGHNLKLKIIADGVQMKEQETLLRKYKCDEVQQEHALSDPEIRQLLGRRWF